MSAASVAFTSRVLELLENTDEVPAGHSPPDLMSMASVALQTVRATAVNEGRGNYIVRMAIDNPSQPVMAADDYNIKTMAAGFLLSLSSNEDVLKSTGVTLTPAQLAAARELWGIVEQLAVTQSRAFNNSPARILNGTLQTLS